MIPKYTVLTYNIGGYEIPREIKVKSENARYLCVVDNPNTDTGDWQKVIAWFPGEYTTMEKCYKIRFNPFYYADMVNAPTDVVIRVDGSMGIEKNLDDIIETFERNNSDIGVNIHPVRNNIMDEYDVWCEKRHLPVEDANKVLKFLYSNAYDAKNYRGLIQGGFQVLRNNKVCNDINNITLDLLKYLGNEKDIHRVDQTIQSFVIQRMFPDIKIDYYTSRIFDTYLSLHNHKSVARQITPDLIEPYFYNEKVKCVI